MNAHLYVFGSRKGELVAACRLTDSKTRVGKRRRGHIYPFQKPFPSSTIFIADANLVFRDDEISDIHIEYPPGMQLIAVGTDTGFMSVM